MRVRWQVETEDAEPIPKSEARRPSGQAALDTMMTVWNSLLRWFASRRLTSSSDDMEGKIWFEGGSGESIDEAILIRGADHDLVGTWAEFAFLDDRFGQKDRDWRLKLHSHGTYGDREIDTVRLEMPNGEQLTLYFDITESFGKSPADYFARDLSD